MVVATRRCSLLVGAALGVYLAVSLLLYWWHHAHALAGDRRVRRAQHGRHDVRAGVRLVATLRFGASKDIAVDALPPSTRLYAHSVVMPALERACGDTLCSRRAHTLTLARTAAAARGSVLFVVVVGNGGAGAGSGSGDADADADADADDASVSDASFDANIVAEWREHARVAGVDVALYSRTRTHADADAVRVGELLRAARAHDLVSFWLLPRAAVALPLRAFDAMRCARAGAEHVYVATAITNISLVDAADAHDAHAACARRRRRADTAAVDAVWMSTRHIGDALLAATSALPTSFIDVGALLVAQLHAHTHAALFDLCASWHPIDVCADDSAVNTCAADDDHSRSRVVADYANDDDVDNNSNRRVDDERSADDTDVINNVVAAHDGDSNNAVARLSAARSSLVPGVLGRALRRWLLSSEWRAHPGPALPCNNASSQRSAIRPPRAADVDVAALLSLDDDDDDAAGDDDNSNSFDSRGRSRQLPTARINDPRYPVPLFVTLARALGDTPRDWCASSSSRAREMQPPTGWRNELPRCGALPLRERREASDRGAGVWLDCAFVERVVGDAPRAPSGRRRVVLSAVTAGYTALALHWQRMLDSIGVRNHLLIAEDCVTYRRLLADRRVDARRVAPPLARRTIALAAENEWKSPQWSELVRWRPLYVKYLLALGVDVLWLDADTSFRRSPLSIVDALLAADDDVDDDETPDDRVSLVAALDHHGDGRIDSRAEFAHSPALLYAATQRRSVVALLDAWIDQLDADVRPRQQQPKPFQQQLQQVERQLQQPQQLQQRIPLLQLRQHLQQLQQQQQQQQRGEHAEQGALPLQAAFNRAMDVQQRAGNPVRMRSVAEASLPNRPRFESRYAADDDAHGCHASWTNGVEAKVRWLHCDCGGWHGDAALARRVGGERVAVDRGDGRKVFECVERLRPTRATGRFAIEHRAAAHETVDECAEARGLRLLPVIEPVAKNVGLRRACGRFVLGTNGDSVITEGFWRMLARNASHPQSLEALERVRPRLHRAARFEATHFLSAHAGVEQVEPFLRAHMSDLGCGAATQQQHDDGHARVRNGGCMRGCWSDARCHPHAVGLCLEGCGDFEMMSKASWHRVRGIRAIHTYSHHDSAVVFDAVRAGIDVRFHERPRAADAADADGDHVFVIHQRHDGGQKGRSRALRDDREHKEPETNLLRLIWSPTLNDVGWGAPALRFAETVYEYGTKTIDRAAVGDADCMAPPFRSDAYADAHADNASVRANDVRAHDAVVAQEPSLPRRVTLLYATRDDDYGGNVTALERLQRSLDVTDMNLARYPSDVELLIVEWNVAPDRPLAAKLRVPRNIATTRIIHVPASVHARYVEHFRRLDAWQRGCPQRVPLSSSGQPACTLDDECFQPVFDEFANVTEAYAMLGVDGMSSAN